MEDKIIIKEFIIDYNKPFLFNEMLDLLVMLGYKKELIINVLDELFEENLLFYDKVLPIELGNCGFAFVTNKYYDELLRKYLNKRFEELEINDTTTQNKILKLANEIRSNKFKGR